MKDNYSLWREREDEIDRWLKSRPVCGHCEEPIQEEHAIEIDGQLICEDCIYDYMREHYRVRIED